MTADDEARRATILRFEALRVQLADSAPRNASVATVALGLPAVDETAGGLCVGAINEFSGPSASGALFLGVLLERALKHGSRLALVDAADSFEPNQWAGPLLRRMLWVRCHSVQEAVRSVDLLLRDGNLPVVVLDLQALPKAAFRRLPGSTWHRFARTLETSGTILVVLSVTPTAEGVRLRITDESKWPFSALQEPRQELRSSLRLSVRERGATERRRIA